LNASHPDLQLVLLPGTALAALNKGEADVAIRSVRPEDDGLIRKRIGAVRFGLYGTAKFSRHPPEDWTFISYDQSLDHLPQQMWLHRIRSGRWPSHCVRILHRKLGSTKGRSSTHPVIA
jgi:DNA-binding transcriptional LysR family regulator